MKVLLVCIFSVSVVQPRKYDIDMESVKLYGEDLNAVLLRFRKSPEYLSILEDKLMTEMKAQLVQRMNQITDYYYNLLDEKVAEMMQIKGEGRLRNFRRNIGNLFMGRLSQGFRNPRLLLRQDTIKNHHGHPLDRYIKKRQILPTERVNFYKDLGFEYAGYAIHAMIKNMGHDETPGRSTKQPFGDEHQDHSSKTTATTEHHEHSVTLTDVDVTTAAEVEVKTVPETFRYGFRPKIIRT